MRSSGSSGNEKYFGSFRIRLGRDASTEVVPKTPQINICGNEVYILEGVGVRLRRGWKFSVNGQAFGWDDSKLEQIIFNDQVIFNENNAKSGF